MKAFIRRWLDLPSMANLLAMQETQAQILDEIIKLRSDLSVTFYDEMDSRRQKMSRELGERVRQRLIAEDKARRHTLGEL